MFDLCCFSFLSALRVLHIESYPQPNSGSIASDMLGTITPDGPIVALLAASLGLKVSLVSNNVGDDFTGNQLIQLLGEYNIHTTATVRKDITTPLTIGLYDRQENRTWFSFLPHVVDGLLSSNLEMLKSSRMAYIDIYAILSEATPRVIHYAVEHHIPLFINLGGDHLSEKMVQLMRNAHVLVVQTGIDSSSQIEPEQYAREIQKQAQSDLAIVTLGSQGAFCATSTTCIHIPAYELQIIHTDGAGAAFSAGLAYALLNEWNVKQSMKFASALGGLYCTERDGFGKFSSDLVLEFIQNIRQN